MAIFKKLLRFVQKKKLFKEWSTEYIEFVKTKSLKAKTLSEIERHVFLLDKEFGELTLTEITPLHITQQKTGARIALPLDLRLDAANLELGGVIERCKKYGSVESDYLLRKSNGEPLSADYVSSLFGKIRTWAEIGGDSERPNPPTLHEIRSLSERMYREQGINTQILLGHKSRSMTDMYNDDRGLTKDAIKYLVL